MSGPPALPAVHSFTATAAATGRAAAGTFAEVPCPGPGSHVSWGRSRVVAGVCLASLVPGVVACGDEGGDGGGARPQVDVDRFDIGVSLDQPIVLGDTLLAGSGSHSLGADGVGLYRSDDRGETWEPAEPPGVPGWIDLHLASPALVDDGLAAVSGRLRVEDPAGGLPPTGDAYVWTTSDGTTWRGGRLTGPGPSVVTVHGVDGLLVAATTTGRSRPGGEQRLELYRSADDGASWTRAGVTGLTVLPDQVIEVVDLWRLGDGRLAAGLSREVLGASSDDPPLDRTALVSADDGATWTAAPCPVEAPRWSSECRRPDEPAGVTLDEIDPPAEAVDVEEDPPSLEGAVELPGGGWLAAASAQETGDKNHGFVLRSDDGSSWRPILSPDDCAAREDIERSNSWYSTPVSFGEGWLVAYACGDVIGTAESTLYLLDADGTNPTEIPDAALPDGLGYGQPLTVGAGDDVLVLAGGDEGSASLVVRLRP